MIRDSLISLYVALPYEIRRLLFIAIYPQSYIRLQQMRKIETENGYSLKPFDDYKCIFIHIPKCAGISICRTLFGNLAGNHMSILKYQIIYNKNKFDTYFKFTFVRNPWDRLVSAYFFLKKGGLNKSDKLWSEKYLSSCPDFDSFVKGWINQKHIQAWKHFRPQYKYICNSSDTPQVDFIGYFENIQEDFNYIQNKIGNRSTLSHHNKAYDKRKYYQEYYTDETKHIVASIYQKDIQIFGYTFDRPSPRNR